MSHYVLIHSRGHMHPRTAQRMDQLMQWHHEHENRHVSLEVESAWLHHRFTRIHPFQDGNGRVARNLASLVFIKSGWFPLTISNDEGLGFHPRLTPHK